MTKWPKLVFPPINLHNYPKYKKENMTISVKMITDSVNTDGTRLSTMVLEYPRFIHAEFMTHRVFSRNASSSRAIPVQTILNNILDTPALPVHWGSNKPGMQAGEELTGEDLEKAKNIWDITKSDVVYQAGILAKLGLHKQVANRITEPFAHIKVVVTATEWENFFTLRNHEMAQPEIHELARKMKECMDDSVPENLGPHAYHLPFVTSAEVHTLGLTKAIKCSVARCARVSYLNHDKTNPDVDKDIDLHDILLNAGHYSPFEHIATPITEPGTFDPYTWGMGITNMCRNGSYWSGNFRNWIQYRQLVVG